VVSQNHLKVSRAFGRLDLTEDMSFRSRERAPEVVAGASSS
jgi:hypothetical protein